MVLTMCQYSYIMINETIVELKHAVLRKQSYFYFIRLILLFSSEEGKTCHCSFDSDRPFLP